jgi:hypothetical protein
MTRKWSILLLAALAIPCHAATRVTIAQLDSLLAADYGQPDGRVALQIEKLELTERASSSKLASWQNAFSGPKARLALTVLTDASACLALPAADHPNLPDPDRATQIRIYNSIAAYVNNIVPKLPNFLADRVTTRFEDNLPYPEVPPLPEELLHLVGTSTVHVLYRDQHEVIDNGKNKRAEYKRNALTSNGEFGPILVTILLDSARGKVFWDHWEQGAAGPIAVFRYTVPQDQSHYSVSSIPEKDSVPIHPAYHGQIAADPNDGTILRLTMQAEMAPADHTAVADIAVEYAPVSIGGKTYTCPIKSVAIAKVRRDVPLGFRIKPPTDPPLYTRINHVVFQNYHLFRGETRILSDDDPEIKAP